MLTSLLIMMAFIAISCANNTNESADDPGYKITFDDSGNKIVTVNKGIAHFSMEFPSGFRFGTIKIDKSGGTESLTVDFIGPVTPDVGLPLISINVDSYEDSFTAERAAESLLNQARNYNNFKLLDESTKTVAGVTAYQHSYYFDTWPYDHTNPPEDAAFVTWLSKEVFFDYIEFSYTLRLGSDPSREEQDMAAFDRILETFKILD